MQSWDRRLVDPLSVCRRCDGSSSYVPSTGEREILLFVRSEFWKCGCRHRVMDRTKETRSGQQPGDWRLLAERASEEMDPEKLMNLVLELNSVLEEQPRNYRISNRASHENRSREPYSN